MKAPFIVIDGMDGSGKGTQISLLAARMGDEGRNFILTREPGGTPLSEKIRDIFSSPEGADASARTQYLLMWAARSHWMEKVVIPYLSAGTLIISDRGDSSTIAYQVYAKMAPELEDDFWRMRKFVFGEHSPTRYIILDIPAEEAKRRIDADTSRVKSPFDMKPLEWYKRVREGFQTLHEELPHHVTIINGARTPEIIHEEIYRIVKEHCRWK